MNRWRTKIVGTGSLLALLLAACGGDQQAQTAQAQPEADTTQKTTTVIAPQDVVFENLQVKAAVAPSPGDPERGAEVMTTRKLGNCVACHQVSALSDTPFHGSVGPSLDGAGTRWQTGQLRALVVNAKTYFPQTVMPAYYRTDNMTRVRDEFQGQPILTAQQVEDVVAFLKTLK